MNNKTNSPAETPSNMEKDPSEWTTGDEPMTGAQKSYLKTLSDEAKEPFDDTLTKADASRRIDELQKKTGRGGAVEGRGTRDAKVASSERGGRKVAGSEEGTEAASRR
jgi:hypothetical protein